MATSLTLAAPWHGMYPMALHRILRIADRRRDASAAITVGACRRLTCRNPKSDDVAKRDANTGAATRHAESKSAAWNCAANKSAAQTSNAATVVWGSLSQRQAA
jgi:hypothetical protein